MKNRESIIILTLLLTAVPLTVRAGDLWLKEIEKELMCTCSCSMVLEPCECETAGHMRGEIQKMIDSGMTKKAILTSYVQRYGERILASPKKQGFNLSAWILPFAAPLFVGFALILLLRRWSGKPKKNEQGVPANSDSSYYEMLQKELDEFEEGEEE